MALPITFRSRTGAEGGAPPAPKVPRNSLPAKLVGPGAAGVLRRESLLRRIEAADSARIVWIGALWRDDLDVRRATI